jgi:SNF2 family DNA or RNA helicase
MIYKPRKYQQHTTEQIVKLSEVGPFLDMGLGKTVSTLTAIVELLSTGQAKKVLIIAPKKVAETVWTDEIEKWDHLNHLKSSQILGPEKNRKKALAASADIYIINRENIVWLVALLGNNWPFDMVIVDESSSFKNPNSQRFKSLKLVRSYIKRVVCLTGTPAPNGLLDLWSQVYLLDKGKRLGETYTRYRDKYFNAGKRDGHIVFNYNLKKGDNLLGDDFYRKEIFDRIGDICFSMKTTDYLELPDKIDNNQFIVLPKDVQAKYDEFEKEQVLSFADKEITAINAAALTNKLLQFANGMVYDENKVSHEVHNEKLDRLKEVVEELSLIHI